jgi:hypothetical protein
MALTVQLAPLADVPSVRYQWDPDTDILSAEVDAPAGLADAHQAVREALGGRAAYHADDAARAPGGVADAPPAGAGVVGVSGAIEVEGKDGSWLSLELVDGRIGGVQVAVWPTVRRRAALTPPTAPACAAYAVSGAGAGADRPVALELSARVAAETDRSERVFHFVFGPPRATERARIARDIVLEVDERRRLAGLWLLNVPPFPHDT